MVKRRETHFYTFRCAFFGKFWLSFWQAEFFFQNIILILYIRMQTFQSWYIRVGYLMCSICTAALVINGRSVIPCLAWYSELIRICHFSLKLMYYYTCMPPSLSPKECDVVVRQRCDMIWAFSSLASSPCCRVPILRSNIHGNRKCDARFSSKINSEWRLRK